MRIALTPAAIEAWKIGDLHALHRALDVPPWAPSQFRVGRANPPGIRPGSVWEEAWPRSWALRQALIEAAGLPGRVGRHGEPLGPAVAGEPLDRLHDAY
jgi:hypothetical protein